MVIRFRTLFLTIAAAYCLQAGGQVAPPATASSALERMAAGAGTVFQGEVVAIRRLGPDAMVPEVVEVDFRIDEAVRGCAMGQIYTLREWGGLWSSGDRYAIGQQRLMMLHSGAFSSPVMGDEGAIPLRNGEADLRWINATLQHPAAPLRQTPITVQKPIRVSPPSVPVRPIFQSLRTQQETQPDAAR